MTIQSVGRRNPALLAKRPVDPDEGKDFFVGSKALTVQGERREPGAPIPEAAAWPRLESWIRTGAVVRR